MAIQIEPTGMTVSVVGMQIGQICGIIRYLHKVPHPVAIQIEPTGMTVSDVGMQIGLTFSL